VATSTLARVAVVPRRFFFGYKQPFRDL